MVFISLFMLILKLKFRKFKEQKRKLNLKKEFGLMDRLKVLSISVYISNYLLFKRKANFPVLVDSI